MCAYTLTCDKEDKMCAYIWNRNQESELCVLIFGQVMGEGAGCAYMYIWSCDRRMRCVYLHLDW